MMGLIAQGAIAVAVASNVTSVATTLSTSTLSATTVTGVETSSPVSSPPYAPVSKNANIKQEPHEDSVQFYPYCSDLNIDICRLHGYSYSCDGFGRLSASGPLGAYPECYSTTDGMYKYIDPLRQKLANHKSNRRLLLLQSSSPSLLQLHLNSRIHLTSDSTSQSSRYSCGGLGNGNGGAG